MNNEHSNNQSDFEPRTAAATSFTNVSMEVPAGILRSQQAYWRELPQLLKTKRYRDQWVCYHGDERIGIGAYDALIRECVRRRIADDQFHLDTISTRAAPPWESEEVEPIPAHHLHDDAGES